MGVCMELSPLPPYRLELTVWALRRRDRNRIDRWDGVYRRALQVGSRAIGVEVTQHGRTSSPALTVELLSPGDHSAAELAAVRFQVTRLLGLDVDLGGFYGLAESHGLSRPLVDRFLGVRPPRFPTLFEALCNAVANQQLSLEVGLTLLNRLTDALGTDAPGDHELSAFPTPEAVLAADPCDLRTMGFSSRKTEYLQGIAHAIATGAIDEAALEAADRTAATRELMTLRGIGRWSAEYVLLRGLGRLDVFPGDDVGARNKLTHFMGLDHPPSYDEITGLLSPWDPYAGMLYFHLLLDGLADRDQLSIAAPSKPSSSPERRPVRTSLVEAVHNRRISDQRAPA